MTENDTPIILAVDLDNTLWGGIIGDDGLEGIELGPDTPEGACFEEFWVRASRARRKKGSDSSTAKLILESTDLFIARPCM